MAAVEKVAGRAPAETETIGNFTVQEYRFGRILPFLQPLICTAVYSDDGMLVETFAGGMPEEEVENLK